MLIADTEYYIHGIVYILRIDYPYMLAGPECETLNQIVNPPCIVILVNAPSLGRGVLPSHICPGETLHFRQGCRIRGSRPGFLSLSLSPGHGRDRAFVSL